MIDTFGSRVRGENATAAGTAGCSVEVEQAAERRSERFTTRLEAFSDLVFGFSLSLLATRLDVPDRPEEIFAPGRWVVIIATFGLVCRFWLEHYRVFRDRFVAGNFDAVVNFVFLFAIAILPYSLQTLLRFELSAPSFSLYVCDFALIFLSLATLRVRSLTQRRGEADLDDRLRGWRRSLIQFAIAVLMLAFLGALRLHGGTLRDAMNALDLYVVGAFVVIIGGVRKLVTGLPRFLR
jgi:uncharacterized membrane protein